MKEKVEEDEKYKEEEIYTNEMCCGTITDLAVISRYKQFPVHTQESRLLSDESYFILSAMKREFFPNIIQFTKIEIKKDKAILIGTIFST